MSANGTLVLDSLASGVPVNVFVYNNAGAAVTFALVATEPGGSTYGTVQSCHNGLIAAIGTSGVSIPVGYAYNLVGTAIYTSLIGWKLELTW
jgi:Na+/H+-dicarboxylate symporter